MNETFEVITNAVKALKSELDEDSFEFQYSDASSMIEVIDLNCEEEHEDLDKIYMIGYHVEDGSFGLFFRIFVILQINFQKRTRCQNDRS